MIRELKTLVAVAQAGTFAAAGNRIGLTQAAVSAQMQRLEAELGFALFERKGRSAQLNRMGHQTLLQAQELIRLYHNLGSSPAGQPAVLHLTIGAIASMQCSLLPDALAAFHRLWPQCRTRVIPGVSMNLVNQVDAGEIDLAAIIRPPFSLQSDLRWTSLAQEPYRLIVPAEIPGDDWMQLLSSQPLIRYDRSSFGGRQVDRFLRQMPFSVREVCELDELEAIIKLVARGLGVALIPQTASHHPWPEGIRALDLGEQTFHRDVGLVHRDRQSLNESTTTLIDLLQRPARCAETDSGQADEIEKDRTRRFVALSKEDNHQRGINMSNDHAKPQDKASEDQPYTPTVDQSGEPVEVVRKDIDNQDSPAEGVDKIITPTSNREKEQDAETLKEKNREVEDKLAGRE